MEEIFDYLDFHKDDMIKMLSDWVKIPSIAKFNPKSEIPFGKDCADMLGLALNDAEKLGLVKTKNHSNYVGTIELNDTKPVLGVAAHLDVVPIGSEKWDHNPWGGIIDDGKVYGRGSSDNKSAAVAAIFALSAIKKYCKTDKNIRVYLGCCEETGMHDFAYYHKNVEKKSDMPPMIVPDAGAVISYGCRGGLISEFDIDVIPNSDIYVSNIICGGNSSVPGKAQATICGIKKDMVNFDFSTLDCTVDILDTIDGILINVIGKACHPCAPEGGKNAAIALLKILVSLPISKPQLSLFKALDKMYENETKRLREKGTTFVIIALNLNNNHLHIEHTSRSEDNKFIDENKAIFKKYLQPDNFEINFTKETPPYLIDPNCAFVKKLIDIQTEFDGKKPNTRVSVSGNYSRCFDLGIAYGHYSAAMAHQKDEYIPIGYVLKTAKLLAATMYRFCMED